MEKKAITTHLIEIVVFALNNDSSSNLSAKMKLYW